MASVAISRVPWAVITMIGVSGASSRQLRDGVEPVHVGQLHVEEEQVTRPPRSWSNMAAAVGATSTS